MTPTQRAAVEQAIETLESLQGGCTDSNDGTVEALTVWCPEVIDALRAALAEPMRCPEDGGACGAGGYCRPEPKGERVAWIRLSDDSIEHSYKPWMVDDWVPLYAHPPQRQPLTEEQVWADDGIMSANAGAQLLMPGLMELVRAVERAHGIGEKT